jgi:hypothetical protein
MLKVDLSKAELAGDKFLVAFITKPVTPLFHSPIFYTFFILKLPASPSLEQFLEQSLKLPKSRTRLQCTYIPAAEIVRTFLLRNECKIFMFFLHFNHPPPNIIVILVSEIFSAFFFHEKQPGKGKLPTGYVAGC